MNQLRIIGLGPGGKQYLTLEALECIQEKKTIYARTMKHPVMDYLIEMGGQFVGMDHYYEEGQTFDEVYLNIAQEIIDRLSEQDVIYAVPGNPFVAERTVEILLEKLDPDQVTIIHGASFIDAIITTLHIDPVHGMKIVDALKIEESRLDVLSDALIIQVYDKQVASRVKLALMEHYEDDQEVWIVRGAGIPGEEVIEKRPLYELDHSDALDHLTSVYVKRVTPDLRKKFVLEDLLGVMRTLRSEDGCAWDREQTHESLRKSLIEEVYEVVQTIDDGDLWGMEEELGDLLLQIVFHAEIAAEQGYFNMYDVITGIYDKMIRRHPHVFADQEAEDVQAVLDQWEDIKASENKSDEIPMAFPPILRSYKVIKRLKKMSVTDQAFADIKSRMTSQLQGVLEGQAEDQETLAYGLGGLVFDLVYLASKADIDLSEALVDYGESLLEAFEDEGIIE